MGRIFVDAGADAKKSISGPDYWAIMARSDGRSCTVWSLKPPPAPIPCVLRRFDLMDVPTPTTANNTGLKTQGIDSSDADALYTAIAAAGPNGRYSARSVPIKAHILQRERFRGGFGYAVPTRGAIGRIKSFAEGGLILEVAAGRGLWSRLLAEAGAEVIATDAYAPSQSTFKPLAGSDFTFCPVRECNSYNAVQSIDANLLLMIWPPCSSLAHQTLLMFNGNKVAYVGDARGHLTASRAFIEALASDWRPVESVKIPQWLGSTDALHLYERKVARG